MQYSYLIKDGAAYVLLIKTPAYAGAEIIIPCA